MKYPNSSQDATRFFQGLTLLCSDQWTSRLEKAPKWREMRVFRSQLGRYKEWMTGPADEPWDLSSRNATLKRMTHFHASPSAEVRCRSLWSNQAAFSFLDAVTCS